ncbi:hypothetical protein C4N9_14430 [Pararhodobacter marinus]|uniref:DUF2029 domain-containing protein n=1 Tax=Pararhodobacter marinus TaxID=2184063 RepID=A0A2U2C8B5_9RHOB|nr:glycosyltransferase family 87 protein [Pararhodobacter marinus]PWE28034.1 hypothetical protein C4N9_14430 [Pararhodobacter marinus]
MTEAGTGALRSRLIAGLLMAFFYFAIWQSALMLPDLGSEGVLVDFDAFYIVGGLVAEGRAVEAYDLSVMAGIQRGLTGQEGFMPWTYPPQFDLLVAALPLLPRGIAYALVTGLGLTLYLWVLAQLAGRQLVPVLLALVPPIYVTLTIGQNAFVTGALMGLFALLTLKGSGRAGWPLGLLVIKPHLGIGLGVHALASGRWRVIGLALAIAVVSAGIATAVLGVQIWPAFRQGMANAQAALAVEFYPMFRMTSVYALLHTLGVPPGLAIWLQGAVALGACALVALSVRRGLPLRHTLAMACFASALVSPYLYDYDMTVLGVGLALIMGDLRARASGVELVLLYALVWVAGGWGMIHAISTAGMSWEARAAHARETLSYGAVAYLLLLGLGARILSRPLRGGVPA